MEGQFNEFVKRLSVLETELKLLRSQNRHLKVIVVILFSLSLLPYIMAAQQQVATFSVVKAEKIEIVKDGETTGIILPFKSAYGSGLLVSSKDEKLIACFGADSEGGKVAVFNKDNAPVAGFEAIPEGGRMIVTNRNGKPLATLEAISEGGILRTFNKDGKLVAVLGASPEGGKVAITNKDGKIAIGFDANPEGGRIMIFNKEEKPIMGLYAIPQGGRIEIANPNSADPTKVVVAITVAHNGSGVILTADAFNNILWASPLK